MARPPLTAARISPPQGGRSACAAAYAHLDKVRLASNFADWPQAAALQSPPLRGRNPRSGKRGPGSTEFSDFVLQNRAGNHASCPAHRLIVEVDGAQHNDPLAMQYDRMRTAYLKNSGWSVLRFTNDDVLKDIEGVCQHIIITATQRGLQ